MTAVGAAVDPARLDAARTILAGARRIVAFTGAGVSAESGIPTFRGAGGIWEEIPPERFGTTYGLRALLERDPAELVRMLRRIGAVLLGAQPNAAHRAIGALEQAGRALGTVTQNVDDLHELGGSRTLAKLHGDLNRWRCLSCGGPQLFAREQLRALLAQLAGATDRPSLLERVPHCPCGGLLRPDVVLFGEMLPAREVHRAERLLQQADAVLVVGTSGVVEPAAGLARAAIARGAACVEVNLEPSAFTPDAKVSLFGPAGTLLPVIV